MSDQSTNENGTTDEQQPAGTEGTPPEGTEGAPAGEGTEQEGGEGTESKLSHEDALKELTRVRGEAANYRTRLREAEKKLADAKTPEDIEAAVAEFKTANADLERKLLVTSVAQKHKLPAELAARLQGATEAELEADAAALAKFIPEEEEPPPAHLGGGLDPKGGDPDEGLSPRELARKHVRRRR